MGLEFIGYPVELPEVEPGGPSEEQIAAEFDQVVQERIQERLARLEQKAAVHQELSEAAMAASGQGLAQNPEDVERIRMLNDRLFEMNDVHELEPGALEPQDAYLAPPIHSAEEFGKSYPKFQYSLLEPPYDKAEVGKQTSAAATCDKQASYIQMKRGWLCAHLKAYPPGGNAYANAMTGSFITARAKADSIRITTQFQLDYNYNLAGLLGFASMELRLTAGIFKGRASEAYNESVVEKHWVVGAGWPGNSRRKLQLSVSCVLRNVKGGHKYWIYGGMEQWAGCGGLLVAATNMARAYIFGIQAVQYRKGGV